MRRFVCALGVSSGDCGPAALVTLVRHYGGSVSLARARSLAGADARGADLGHLRGAAEELGLEAVCGTVRREMLRRIPLPAILRVKDGGGHFVVLHRVRRNRVLLADPAIGLVRTSWDMLALRWDRRVLLARPTQALAHDPGDDRSWREIAAKCWEHRMSLGACLALAVLVSGTSFAISLVAQVAFDRFLPGRAPGLLPALSVAAAALVLFAAAGAAARSWLLVRLGVKVELALGGSYVERTFAQGLEYFGNTTPGDMYSRFADVSAIRAALTGTTLTLLLELLTLLGCTAALAWYSVPLTLLGLPAFIFSGLSAAAASRPMIRAERRSRQAATAFAHQFVEWVGVIRAVKAACAGDEVLASLRHSYAEAKEAWAKHSLLSQEVGVAVTAFAGLGVVSVLLFGAHLAALGKITPGELVLFYSGIGLTLAPVHRLSSSIAAGQAGAVGLERIKIPAAAQAEAPADRPNGQAGTLRMQKASFRYGGARSAAISGVTGTVAPGETLAIVGPSGSGKTTLALLMAGLIAPTDGEVLLFDLQIHHARLCAALAPHEPGLTSGTVRENIALGSPGASMTEIVAASRLAEADEFIRELPYAYEQPLGTLGGRLSSGQRQRVGLARALLLNRDILILDEATNAVEPGLEAALLRRLLQARRGRITVLATHRPSVAALASRVLFLRGGRVRATGAHHRLIADCEEYRLLWAGEASEVEA